MPFILLAFPITLKRLDTLREYLKDKRKSSRLLCFRWENHIIDVVRQQFVVGINCSIFLYRNSFGANQRLTLTRKSFRIEQGSNCAVFSRFSSRRMFCSNGLTPCMLCVQILLRVVCIGLVPAEIFSTVNTGLGRPMFGTSVYVEYS